MRCPWRPTYSYGEAATSPAPAGLGEAYRVPAALPRGSHRCGWPPVAS
jgi:hypothetical protein